MPVELAETTAEPPRLATVARTAARTRWVRELCLMVAVYAVYSLIRNLAPDQVVEAQHNAQDILAAERLIGIDVERPINLWAAGLPGLIIPANYYYATLHLSVTAVVLFWLYRRDATRYVRARSVLLVMTLIALAGYWLYPLAPPRLMTGGGYIDTVRQFGLWGFTPSDDLVSLSNQYAAMPSMHVGWALWVGVAVVWLARRRWVRVLGALYPVATLGVVVVTANHFLLDAVAAIILFLIAPLIVNAYAEAMTRLRPGLQEAGGST